MNKTYDWETNEKLQKDAQFVQFLHRGERYWAENDQGDQGDGEYGEQYAPERH